ncbi:type II toxin-antitoxin system RelE/ParE family toxin [Patescibacteria group bacterium]|nr:type II toxin-antitoxin system RelE/ParE family toxin [Patescibacteria group bacterium]MBU1200610.1 type II toxin-antitoxin system RelE/ParE family toxin [Patescibacteria group bacterium]MBU1256613.1 type II toxin-antitoxin system RelE/ParE family toxin [Patescibacteria group bacterium]MBU1457447.1 type II toxin-antitoxin system RelE/ParE family toxin [Patescibacteria group bacterium]
MNLYPTPHFKRKLKQRIKTKPSLQLKIKQKLELLIEKSDNPALRLHKLKGKRINQYSIHIESNLRITFFKEGKNYILTDLITHDQY